MDKKNSFGEKIFSSPRLYQTKIAFLKTLNGFGNFSINDFTRDKEVLDIGCGSVQLFYDPKKTKRRVGIDTSSALIEEAKKLYPSTTYFVSNVEDVPLAPKSFDVVVILFMLHHTSLELGQSILEKAKEASRESVIILDHEQHNSFFPALIQRSWWKLADGGSIYRTQKEWHNLLSIFKIEEYRRMGTLFGNICYYRLNPNNSVQQS